MIWRAAFRRARVYSLTRDARYHVYGYRTVAGGWDYGLHRTTDCASHCKRGRHADRPQAQPARTAAAARPAAAAAAQARSAAPAAPAPAEQRLTEDTTDIREAMAADLERMGLWPTPTSGPAAQ